MAGGLEKTAILGVGGFGHGQVKGIHPHPVGRVFVGIAPRFADRGPQQIITAGDEVEFG